MTPLSHNTITQTPKNAPPLSPHPCNCQWLIFHPSVSIIFLMGQINCQCQQASTEEYVSIKRHPDGLSLLPTESNEPTQILTKMALTSGQHAFDIPLTEGSSVTFGSTEDCEIQHPGKGQFKAEVRYRNRCVFVRDCGVGLGVFIRKRRVLRKPGSTEVLIHILDQWVVVKVLPSRQIVICVYSGEGASRHCLDDMPQQEVNLGTCILRVRRQQNEYRIGRTDKGEMWVLAGDEQRVRSREILRLGTELFTVGSISSYLESSPIVIRH